LLKGVHRRLYQGQLSPAGLVLVQQEAEFGFGVG
jgi:hypothetical protein